MRPCTPSAYTLFHKGAQALSRMESVGLPVSREGLLRTQKKLTTKKREAEAELRKNDIYIAQQRKFGKECSLGSRDQLAWVLYEHMGLPGGKKSAAGRYVLNEDALEALELDYLTDYLSLQKLDKVKGTYIDALLRDEVNGRVHGFLNLHTVKTFRGSADSPNLNNLPSRNKTITRFVKGNVVPPPGHHIVECDFSALEVHVAACYHKDPTMIDNLETGFDMHTAVSKQCYTYDDAWIAAHKPLAKELRQAAKSDAVFSWSYGNYYVDVALRLWKTATKLGMLPHLAAHAIKRLGLTYDFDENKWVEAPGKDAFVTHIKAVEHDFWNVRYPRYNLWRREWFDVYRTTGYFHTLTGFLWHGVEKRNFIINAPIQGSAFHCLLQSIIDIDEHIEKHRMKSRLFLQIHDSLLAIVPDEELDDFVEMSRHLMTTALRAKWPWIILNLKTEVEHSDVSWFDKQLYVKVAA